MPEWSATVPGTINAENVELRKDYRNMIRFSSTHDNDFITVAAHICIMAKKAAAKIEKNWLEIGHDRGMTLSSKCLERQTNSN